jgi:hypothetical protein
MTCSYTGNQNLLSVKWRFLAEVMHESHVADLSHYLPSRGQSRRLSFRLASKKVAHPPGLWIDYQWYPESSTPTLDNG